MMEDMLYIVHKVFFSAKNVSYRSFRGLRKSCFKYGTRLYSTETLTTHLVQSNNLLNEIVFSAFTSNSKQQIMILGTDINKRLQANTVMTKMVNNSHQLDSIHTTARPLLAYCLRHPINLNSCRAKGH